MSKIKDAGLDFLEFCQPTLKRPLKKPPEASDSPREILYFMG